ncbi:MAG TPA: hypothetical protein VIL13_01755 [Longimicrobiales bacterium]|jgi:hypothetical protein
MHERIPPPPPPNPPARFRTTVHGTVFGDRARHLERVHEGDELLLIPGPPVDDEPGVWVHLPDGELLGHLPPEIEVWLAPWVLRGGRATARAIRVSGADVPSWRRLLIEVTCLTEPSVPGQV